MVPKRSGIAAPPCSQQFSQIAAHIFSSPVIFHQSDLQILLTHPLPQVTPFVESDFHEDQAEHRFFPMA